MDSTMHGLASACSNMAARWSGSAATRRDRDEGAALDEPAIERAVAEHASHVEAFAIAANFSVRKPGS